MNRHAFFILFLLMISLTARAAKIEGRHEAYAGKKLTFFRYSDPITQNNIPVFTIEFDKEGRFVAEIETGETTFVFTDFGIYRGMLFIGSGQHIRLKLPPFREKSFADRKNPYFKPVEFWFTTHDGNHLNDQIAAFDTQLNQLTDRFFDQLYFNQSKSIFDTIVVNIEKQFGDVSNPAFVWHKKLKIKSVETDAFRLEPARVIPVFSGLEIARWNDPAFIELFDKVFTNQLGFEARTTQGNTVKQAVIRRDIAFLKSWASQKYNVEESAAGLVILKLLHDAFYTGDFSRNDILTLVASPALQQHQNSTIREIAKNVKEKLEHLKPGSKAPVICLKDTNGHRVCTDEAPGSEEQKFKYLIFADTEMVVCQEHLKYLTRTQEQFASHLEIVVVLRKTDLIEMKIFLEEEKIPGIHLVDENGEYTEKYRVKSFPASFLLTAEHEVVFQQTKTPLDGFEQQFGPYLRQKLFERQKNQTQ